MYSPNNGTVTYDDHLDGLLSDAWGAIKSVAKNPVVSGALLGPMGLQTSVILKAADSIGGKKKTTSAPLANSAFSRSKSRVINSSPAVVSAPQISPTIAVDPNIQKALEDINAQLRYAALQREATSEHNSIVAKHNFQSSVLRKLTLLQATRKIPRGNRRDKVIRVIIKAA